MLTDAAAGIDWTTVLVALIAAIPSTLTVILAYRIRRELKTPSGDRIGAIAERTHDMTAVGLAGVARLARSDAKRNPGAGDELPSVEPER